MCLCVRGVMRVHWTIGRGNRGIPIRRICMRICYTYMCVHGCGWVFGWGGLRGKLYRIYVWVEGRYQIACVHWVVCGGGSVTVWILCWICMEEVMWVWWFISPYVCVGHGGQCVCMGVGGCGVFMWLLWGCRKWYWWICFWVSVCGDGEGEGVSGQCTYVLAFHVLAKPVQ